MAIFFDTIMRSKPFKFLVGPGRCEFYVHPALVAHHSKPLGTLTSGSMKEAQECCAHLEDVDHPTFARFSEYIYTGDYPAAPHSVIPESSSIAQGDCQVRSSLREKASKTCSSRKKTKKDTSWELDVWGAATSTHDTERSKRDGVWEKFTTRTFTDEVNPSSLRVGSNQEPCEDYTQVFLSHAQLYVFADKYDMEALKLLALSKLHRTLCQYTLYVNCVPHVAVLLSYCYENTPERPSPVDDLRGLAMQYASCHIEDLIQNEGFKSELKASSAAPVDLVEELLQRMNCKALPACSDDDVAREN